MRVTQPLKLLAFCPLLPLREFSQIPSKENGVDIEGIAFDGDKLYAAFRGPVLRDGYVPILEFEFDKPHKAKTLYVDLGGRGVRDIVRVKKGFLLIGGPVGDAPVSYELYFWDGKDGVRRSSREPPAEGNVPRPQFARRPRSISFDRCRLMVQQRTSQVLIALLGGILSSFIYLRRARKS